MKLTIYNNNKLIKTTESSELKRLFEQVNTELTERIKGFEYEGKEHDMVAYNSFEQLERKLKIFECVHMATLETEIDKIDFYISK